MKENWHTFSVFYGQFPYDLYESLDPYWKTWAILSKDQLSNENTFS